MNSPKYSLNSNDMKKIGNGLLVAVAGAILTYLTDVIPDVDLGQWAPIVMAFWSVAANTARKWISEN